MIEGWALSASMSTASLAAFSLAIPATLPEQAGAGPDVAWLRSSSKSDRRPASLILRLRSPHRAEGAGVVAENEVCRGRSKVFCRIRAGGPYPQAVGSPSDEEDGPMCHCAIVAELTVITFPLRRRPAPAL